MTKKKTLNLDTFNEILFEAFKDQTAEAKAELLAAELQAAFAVKIQMMEEVIEDLNRGRPYREHLKKVNNIDGNLDKLAAQLDELEKEHPEIVVDAETDK